jgi:hypothetical protein
VGAHLAGGGRPARGRHGRRRKRARRSSRQVP